MIVLHVSKSSTYSGMENVAINIIKSMPEDIRCVYLTATGSVETKLLEQNIEYIGVEKVDEKAIKSVMPLGINLIRKDRKVTTSSVAIFMPFLIPELDKQDENDLYYGKNALTGELIFADRKKNNNPNGMFFGKPGSGKSLAAKREIANVVLSSDDDIIISDPEREVRHEVA